jgi:hypothetical protein
MRLELIFWHDKQNNEFHRRIIQGVKLDSACRSSKRSDDFLKPIGRAMWNGDTEADAGAHGFLALFERARMLSRSAVLILFSPTSRSISSTIAGQRSVAFISGMICSADNKLSRDMQNFPSGAQA